MPDDTRQIQTERVTEFLDAVTLGDDIESTYASLQSEFRALLIEIETEKRVHQITKGQTQNAY